MSIIFKNKAEKEKIKKIVEAPRPTDSFILYPWPAQQHCVFAEDRNHWHHPHIQIWVLHCDMYWSFHKCLSFHSLIGNQTFSGLVVPCCPVSIILYLRGPYLFPLTTFASPLSTLWMSVPCSPFQPKMTTSLHCNLSFRFVCLFCFLILFMYLFFVAHVAACRISVSWAGIETVTESPES